MGNFIVSIILIASVLLFTAAGSYFVCGVCDELLYLIDSGSEREAVLLWEEKRDLVSLFVRDAEIDAVSSFTDSLKSADGSPDGREKMLISLREAVCELKRSEAPSFYNVF